MASGQSLVEADSPAAVLHKLRPDAKVIGDDERELVGDTTKLPWSAIGALEAVWYDNNHRQLMLSAGTGTLIGRSIVLTGGHCVYDTNLGWADQVVFIPGKNGEDEPFGRSYSVRTIAQQAWVNQADNRYDIAMVVLENPLGDAAGSLPISVQPTSFFVNRQLNTSGYPAETKSGDDQYHSFGTSTDVENGLIRHNLDSEPGQSGSPIWLYQSDTNTRGIVGVLTGSREVSEGGQVVDVYNVGVYIDDGFAAWIDDTLVKYDDNSQAAAASSTATSSTEQSTAAPACGTGLPASVALTFGFLCFAWMTRAYQRPRHCAR